MQRIDRKDLSALIGKILLADRGKLSEYIERLDELMHTAREIRAWDAELTEVEGIFLGEV